MSDFPEIQRDREFFDGEVGDTLDVWWVKGHDIDPDEFIHAVIVDCLEYNGEVPRIERDDKPIEMWQQNVAMGDGVEYRRSTERVDGPKHSPVFPVTVLDLERRVGRGGRKCMIDKCTEPWQSSTPLRLATTVEMVEDPNAYFAVNVTLCATHRKLMPDPYYRTLVVPVGATAVIPKPEEEPSAPVDGWPTLTEAEAAACRTLRDFGGYVVESLVALSMTSDAAAVREAMRMAQFSMRDHGAPKPEEPEVVDTPLRPVCLTCMSKGVEGVWNADMDPSICSACGEEQTP